MSVLLAAVLAAASPQSLLAAADAFDRAQLAKDGAALERMVLDELVLIDGSGKRLGKKQFIAGWTTAADKFDPITLVDRTVTPLGQDAAVVGAEVNLCGTSGGTRFCSRIRFADTFVLVDGQWQVAHIQVTPIKDQALGLARARAFEQLPLPCSQWISSSRTALTSSARSATRGSWSTSTRC